MNKILLKTSLIALTLMTPISNLYAVEFNLFGDVSLSDNTADGENTGFTLGALDIFATTNISDNTQVLVEYVFEDGGDGLVTDLERLWIKRTINEDLQVALGRFHTPLGVWNRAYHHGAFFQDTVSRPFFLDFEDAAAGVLPVHIVGAFLNGNINLNKGELSYEVFIGNGSSIDSIAGLTATADNKPELEINTSSDPDSNKTIGAHLSYFYADTPLTFGIFYMNNVIAESAETGGLITVGQSLIDQSILGLDAYYNAEKYFLLAEFYELTNDANIGDSKSHNSTAYYVQMGYRFDEESLLTYRHADLDFDATDSYFSLLGATQATRDVLSYRYDLDPSNTLKFEINKHQPDIGDSDTTYTLQWAFAAL